MRLMRTTGVRPTSCETSWTIMEAPRSAGIRRCTMAEGHGKGRGNNRGNRACATRKREPTALSRAAPKGDGLRFAARHVRLVATREGVHLAAEEHGEPADEQP